MNPSRRKKSEVLAKLSDPSTREFTEHEREVLGKVAPDQLAHIPAESEITDAATVALDAFEIAGAAVEQTLLAKANAGRMLATKRASLSHGDWLPFLNSIIPPRFTQRQADGVIENAEAAWHREVLRWTKIASNFDRFPAEALERAHTVRQMLQLADFIPEGEAIPGGHQSTANPAQVVARVEKWWKSAALHRDEIAKWPPRDRADLAEQLRPAAELYLTLLPSA